MKLKSSYLLTAVLLAPSLLQAQQKPAGMDQLTREKLHALLRTEYYEIQQHYYDPRYHGVDLAALYKTLDGRIDHAETLNQGYILLEAFAQALKDTHTYFVPPARTYRSDSGFKYKMIGDKCFVTRVRPNTDAAGKLSPGDQILAFNGFKVERDSFRLMQLYFTITTTQATALYLQAADGKVRHELVQHKIVKSYVTRDYTGSSGEINSWNDEREAEDNREASLGKVAELGDVAVWRQPDFETTDTVIGTAMAHYVMGHKALVLDLRGNPGGYADTLKFMLGELIDHDVTIGTLEARKPEKPFVAKTVKGHVYAGKVFILVDSESASSSELMAREIQLEHRGKVLGDRTAGAVMVARNYEESIGADTVIPARFEITFANLIMSDGKSLEDVGVDPDEKLLPTPADLAAGRDPVLAQAINEAGGNITPEDAGKLFPFTWRPVEAY
jgi:C-terminal processing protease CtpA/Prc